MRKRGPQRRPKAPGWAPLQALREDLPQIFALLGEEKLDPLVAATFPLLAAGQAIELLAAGSVEGKIVPQIPDPAQQTARPAMLRRVLAAWLETVTSSPIDECSSGCAISSARHLVRMTYSRGAPTGGISDARGPK